MNYENEKNHVEVTGESVRRITFSQIDDPILEDGIHLNVYDVRLFTCLFKYTGKHTKTAFPSQDLLSQMMGGVDKKTIKKSTNWLEYLGLITTVKGRNKLGHPTLHYQIQELPEIIIEGAMICKSLENKELFKTEMKKWKEIRKEFEGKPQVVSNEVEEKVSNKKANDSDVIAVFKENRPKYKLAVSDVPKIVEFANIHDDSKTALEQIAEFLKEFDGEVLVKTIKKALKEKKYINDESFKNIALDFYGKKQKQNEYFAKKNYEAGKNYKKESLNHIPSTVSDYSDDEYGDLIEQMKRGEL